MERTWSLSSNAAMVRLIVYKTPQDGYWGELENIYRKEPIRCENLGDMILKLDLLCEELAFPMAFMKTRTFEKEPQEANVLPEPILCHPVNAFNLYEVLKRSKDAPLKSKNCRMEFYIHVFYRQNATMQGCVAWLGKNTQKQFFRSAIELMKLIYYASEKEEVRHDRKENRPDHSACG